MTFRLALAALAGMTMTLATASATAQDIAEGRRLSAQCAVCHGNDGMALRPDVPNIGGESSIYLVAQLRAFRSGQRQDETMSIIAEPLTDEEIADLAAFYAAIEIEVISVPE